jgi:hypothetical protein
MPLQTVPLEIFRGITAAASLKVVLALAGKNTVRVGIFRGISAAACGSFRGECRGLIEACT